MQPTVKVPGNFATSILSNIKAIVTQFYSKKFFRVMGGHIFLQYLAAGVKFDLFGVLDQKGALSFEQIARELQLEERPTKVLLFGLQSAGLLKKKRGKYANTAFGKRFLSSHSPKNVRSMVLWQSEINYHPFVKFTEALQANSNVGLEVLSPDADTLFEALEGHPRLEEIFFSAMSQQSSNLSDALSQRLDFKHANRLLDVGGGNGTYSLALCKTSPNLQSTVFDLPSVAKLAHARILENGLSNRVSFVGGDCFEGPWPEGTFDCVLLAHFLTLWSPDRNEHILKMTFDLLPRGGCAVIFSSMADFEGGSPMSAALGNAYFMTLATEGGYLHSARDYEETLSKIGFSSIKKIDAPYDHTILIATK
ncbi:MAG: methyltransferase [Sulfitobacter sp.]